MTELRHIEDIAVEDDAPREYCGVFAVYGESDSFGAAGMTLNALFGIQHRGQESAGIAVSNGRTISVHKGMGLVREAFTEEDVRRLEGFMAIGHVRYSTAGKGLSVNAQPIKANTSLGTIAIAHNGSLVNADALLSELKSSGAVFESASDAEIILNLMARSGRAHLPEALRDACAKIVGSYALCC